MKTETKCSICTGPEGRLKEVNALLADGEETIKSISVITGASVGTIHRHKQHAFASPQRPESRLHALYDKLEKQTDRLLQKGKTKLAVELLGRLTSLRKQLEASDAKNAGAAPQTSFRPADYDPYAPDASLTPQQAVFRSFSRALGGGDGEPRGKVIHVDPATGKAIMGSEDQALFDMLELAAARFPDDERFQAACIRVASKIRAEGAGEGLSADEEEELRHVEDSEEGVLEGEESEGGDSNPKS